MKKNGFIKRKIANKIEKSQKLSKKLDILAGIGKQYENEQSEAQKAEEELKNVIFPLTKEYQYNKRIYNFLLERELGVEIRRWVVEQMFYNVVGWFPNIDNPKSLNEKMQWMRLYYHDDLMTECVDKIGFKNYISRTIGSEYVVPLLGAWPKVNMIDFDKLPNQFAIKSNWGWGDLQNILVYNKAKTDLEKMKAMLNNWLMPWNNYYYQSFEWDSKNIKPMILAEELLVPTSGEIIDYKFYCYNGKCRHFLICKDRKKKTKYINYNIDFDCIKLSPNSTIVKDKYEPDSNFHKMLELAEKLAKPFPLVRVDFYDVDGRIYVGELTFSPGGGFNTYYKEWDIQMGEWLVLPESNVNVSL